LKPDCFPSTDGGRRGSAASRARKRTMQFSENDQAKPDLFSRLACSTLLSKIHLSSPPERRPFGSRPGCYTRLSSNLLRLPVCFQPCSPVFLREPFKHIELSPHCQAQSFSPKAVPTHCWRYVPRLRISISLTGTSPVQKRRAAQNI